MMKNIAPEINIGVGLEGVLFRSFVFLLSAISAPRKAKEIQGISGYVPVKNRWARAVPTDCVSTLGVHPDGPIVSGKSEGRKIMIVSIGIQVGAPFLPQ